MLAEGCRQSLHQWCPASACKRRNDTNGFLIKNHECIKQIQLMEHSWAIFVDCMTSLRNSRGKRIKIRSPLSTKMRFPFPQLAALVQYFVREFGVVLAPLAVESSSILACFSVSLRVVACC